MIPKIFTARVFHGWSRMGNKKWEGGYCGLLPHSPRPVKSRADTPHRRVIVIWTGATHGYRCQIHPVRQIAGTLNGIASLAPKQCYSNARAGCSADGQAKRSPPIEHQISRASPR